MAARLTDMELVTLKLTDIKPYERNARKNDHAVAAVAESIRQCEYIAPIIVDENHVILAGHTRWKALKQLGRTEAECVVKSGLTDEQKRKYRLLDNKTAELAGWDVDLLEDELDGLDFGELDFLWDSSEEKEDEPKERKEAVFHETISVVVDCGSDEEAEELFERLSREGYECRISTL